MQANIPIILKYPANRHTIHNTHGTVATIAVAAQSNTPVADTKNIWRVYR